MAQLVKNPPAMWETWVWSLGWEDTLEKEGLPTTVFWPGEFHGLYGVTNSRTQLSDFHFHRYLKVNKFACFSPVNPFHVSLILRQSRSLKEDCCSLPKSCPTLCQPMNCSKPGFPVLHYLLEFAQTHVHWVSDAIQPSHPLSSPSPLIL